MAARVLLIGDEKTICHQVEWALVGAGYRVERAPRGPWAIVGPQLAGADLVAVVLAPDKMGRKLCRRLLALCGQPVFVVFSAGTLLDSAQALALGAADCLLSPFDTADLVARTQALLRPAPSSNVRPGYFVDGDLVVDLSRRETWRGGEPLALTGAEYRLLACFVQHPEELLAYERLAAQVWGPSRSIPDRRLGLLVCHLRSKIEPDPTRPQRIVTRRALGYVFKRQEPAPPAGPAGPWAEDAAARGMELERNGEGSTG